VQPSLYAVPPALTAAIALLLGTAILVRSHRSRPALWFFVVTTLVACWLSGMAVLYTLGDERAAIVWAHLATLPVPLLPAAIFHFACVETGVHRRRRVLLAVSWTAAALFALSLAGDAWIAGVRRFSWGFYPVYGGAGGPFLVYFSAIVVLALAELWRDHRRARAAEDRQRSRMFLLAFAVGTLGAVDYLAAYGIDVYPFGYVPVLGLLGICAEAIRRYRLPDPVSMAEGKFRALAGSASDAIASVNGRGDITYVNGAAARVFGLPEGDLLGRPVASLLAPVFRPRWEEFLRSVLTTGADPLLGHTTEAEALRHDGQPFPVEVSLGTWNGPDGTFFTAIVRDISERRQAVAALRSSEEKFRALLEGSAAAVFIVDDARVRYANEAATALTGASTADLLEGPFLERFHVESHDIIRHRVLRAPSPAVAGLRYEARLAGEDDRWVELTGRTLDFAGQPACLVTAFDVTERRRAEDAMRESERRMRDILENVQLVAVLLDRDGMITYCNPFFLELVGYEEEDVIGREWLAAFVPEEDREAGRITLRDRMQLGAVAAHEETAIVTRHGDRRVVAWSNTVLRDWTGEVSGTASIGADVTDRRRAEEQLQHDAFHDALTSLPNRALFIDRLQAALARLQGAAARGHQRGLFAVVFLDVDRFKLVNDSLGHSVGDRLLIELSNALKTAVRPGDTVARLGGDEFTILLEDLEGREEAVTVAERIHAVLREPLALAGHEVFTTVSIGIALSAPGYRRAEDILRDADTAMYHAKALGKSRHQVFDSSMHARARKLLQLEHDLRRALERREFRVHYQPIVRVDDRRIAGFEALVRWQHPQRGLVAPSEFIPLAEETGLVVPLGRAVLEEACRQAAEWRQASGDDLTVSVNLSVKQFTQPDLVEQVDAILRDSGLPSRLLKLEVTESMVMENTDSAIALLRRLKALGVHIAIDDFGTGYSSLSYLLRLPADSLKIDRSFVSGSGDPGRNANIVRTVVGLAYSLGLDVVAEGVETEEQRALLEDLGCPLAQGFLFSPAVDGPAATRLLADAAAAGGARERLSDQEPR
jgi:diguanylate cyclase (GGDEF)-like protein/PAS domain S-box-containing protein